MPRTRHPTLTFALAALFVLDVASDIACGVELVKTLRKDSQIPPKLFLKNIFSVADPE